MNNNSRFQSKKTVIGIVVLILFLYLLIHHFTKKDELNIPIPSVMVQKPVMAKLTTYVTQTGTTVAFNSVDLVARVEGYLRAIEFIDGSLVKKGQELFIIQPEPYMEQLKVAKASVVIAKAQYAYAQSEYARQKRMYQQHASSLNNVEKWLAKSEESKAEVAKAEANEELAAITYSYTHVLAPFDGQIGRHLVSIGNLVGNGVATNLATIEQIEQLYVYFNLNELDLLTLRKAAHAAGIKQENIQKITVGIALQSDDSFQYKATLNFINTGLNASTGTMEFRALMDNKAHIFVPGLFVQVRIPLTNPGAQLTVPDRAILYDQIGAYVYVVDKDDVVQLKRIQPGTKDRNIRGIMSGLQADERVVVEGIQYATPGSKVAPKNSNTQEISLK